MLKLAGIVATVAAVAGLWQFTPMAHWTDPDALGPLLAAVQTSPWAVPAVLAMFILGTLMVLPVTALIAAAAIALGPWSGFLWASVGSMAAALLTYLLGQAMGRRPLERLLGRWIYRVDRLLHQGGIISVFLMRTMPFAPFTIVNIVAGASSIRFRDFFVGTVLGMGPGIAAITLLSDRLRALWEDPTFGSLTLLIVAIAVWLGVVYGLHVLSRRLARR